MEEDFHDINLNIHYSAPKWVFDEVRSVYEKSAYFAGYNPLPTWRGVGIELDASIEPSGIQISGYMPKEIWVKWYSDLQKELTERLGYEIGEPEDGYDFKYF